MKCVLKDGGTKDQNQCPVGDNSKCIVRLCDDVSKTCKEFNKGTPGVGCTTTSDCVHKKCIWATRTCSPAWMPGGTDQCTSWANCARFACQDPTTNTCVEQEGGEYTTMNDCQNACTNKYSCISTMNGYVCAKDVNGTYDQAGCNEALSRDCQPAVTPTPPISEGSEP